MSACRDGETAQWVPSVWRWVLRVAIRHFSPATPCVREDSWLAFLCSTSYCFVVRVVGFCTGACRGESKSMSSVAPALRLLQSLAEDKE